MIKIKKNRLHSPFEVTDLTEVCDSADELGRKHSGLLSILESKNKTIHLHHSHEETVFVDSSPLIL